MDEPWKHYAKLRQTQKKHVLCDSLDIKCPEQGNL